MLIDNHGRPLNYLRLAVTDRCNLRCFYCMPEQGIQYLPKKELLTFEEIIRLVTVLAELGISKLRLTGGEPFVRTDLMQLIRQLVRVNGINEVHVTTNGLLTGPHLEELKALGIRSINLSLDTLDRERFRQITRRDEFLKTRETLDRILELGIPLKVNAVVMENKNIDDILPLVEMTRDRNVSVRFIEEMPFNGEGTHYQQLNWTFHRIVEHIRKAHPELERLPDPANSTAYHYRVPGYQGTVGVIAAFSRSFCGTCNRIRVTAQGQLKTCLYDQGVLSVRDVMRQGSTNEELAQALLLAFRARPRNGFEAEGHRDARVQESMSTIGG